MMPFKVSTLRCDWSLPNEPWNVVSYAVVPNRNDGESSKDYQGRVVSYVRAAYNIPFNANIILT